MSAEALAAEAEAPALYGVVAEFETPEQSIDAAPAVRKAGYTAVEAYTPFAVEGLDTIVGHKPTRLGFVTLLAGMVGLVVGFGMQWYANVVFYPLNIGGRPLNSWPNFIKIGRASCRGRGRDGVWGVAREAYERGRVEE